MVGINIKVSFRETTITSVDNSTLQIHIHPTSDVWIIKFLQFETQTQTTAATRLSLQKLEKMKYVVGLLQKLRSKKLLFPSVSTCNLRSSSFSSNSSSLWSQQLHFLLKSSFFYHLLAFTWHWLLPVYSLCLSLYQSLVDQTNCTHVERFLLIHLQPYVRAGPKVKLVLRKPSRPDKYLRLKRINFIRKPQLRSTECGNQGDEPVSRRAVSMFASRLTLAFGITFSYLRSNSFLFF